jgi:ABC-2 type transport system permease protein
MLWYKAWLETRSRFLIALVGITALCSFTVFHGIQQKMPYTKVSYYYIVLHEGHAMLALMWVVAVTLLMMGGLLREKAAGASSFTLALPVGRARLMSVRILMGLIQNLALVTVPWIAMFLIASFTGWKPLMSQVWFHLAVLAGGGLVFFAVALLISSLVEGEYTAPLVSFGIVIAIGIGFGRESLRAYNPFEFITGEQYFDRRTMLLIGPIPWMHIMVSMLLAVLFIAVSIKVIQAREF